MLLLQFETTKALPVIRWGFFVWCLGVGGFVYPALTDRATICRPSGPGGLLWGIRPGTHVPGCLMSPLPRLITASKPKMTELLAWITCLEDTAGQASSGAQRGSPFEIAQLPAPQSVTQSGRRPPGPEVAGSGPAEFTERGGKGPKTCNHRPGSSVENSRNRSNYPFSLESEEEQ